MLIGNMGVDLSGGNTAVAKHGLDAANISTIH